MDDCSRRRMGSARIAGPRRMQQPDRYDAFRLRRRHSGGHRRRAGWFTIHLRGVSAERHRVRAGRSTADAGSDQARVGREGLQKVQTAGTTADQISPWERSNAVLWWTSMMRCGSRDVFRNLATALTRGGRIGIVNYKPGQGGRGGHPHRQSFRRGRRARRGLRVLARENRPYQYLLVLGR